MKKLTATICLTLAVLLSSVGVSWSADFQKGLTAAQSADFAIALREWKFLAEQGFASAQFNLGLMYQKGQGVPQDYKTAVKWYKLAAEQGFPAAQGNLGVMYAFGTGILKDYVYAHMWGNIAATNGHDLGAELKDDFVQNMTAAQIREAQKIALKCIQKKYKGCLKTSSKSKLLTKRIPSKSVAEIENERLRREISYLRQQNETKFRQGIKRQSETRFPSHTSGFAEKNTKYYDTKLSGLITSLEENGFLLNVGYGRFYIKLKGGAYEPMVGDDITIIGNTNEFYANNAIVFAEKIILHGRKSKSGSLIQRNIEDGWISINGQVSSIFSNVIHIDTDEKMVISLKYIKFIPPLEIGSLVSVNGYLTKDDTGNFFVKANNIIKLSK